MQDSPSYGIEATLLILNIVWKIAVDIHSRRHTAVLVAELIIDKIGMLLRDPLLPLLVIETHSVRHWSDNNFPCLQQPSHLSILSIVVHQVFY